MDVQGPVDFLLHLIEPVDDPFRPGIVFVVLPFVISRIKDRPAMVISQRRALTLRSFPIADDMTRIEATVRVNIGWPYGTGDANMAVRFAAS